MLVSRRLLISVYAMLMAVMFAAYHHPDSKSGRSANGATTILLFNGAGISVNDVAAMESVLTDMRLGYTTVNSPELDGMNSSQLGCYRLLIFPGGDFVAMGKGLKPATAANIRGAVQQGLNYLGICAGGFLAGRSAYYNGFDLASGATFGFYAAANKGIRKAALPITGADGKTLDQYWQDGPQLSGWGDAVAKYPDGSPAVAQGKCGKGFLILAGIHPEAPDHWRQGMTFNTSTDIDNAYAATLIRAALSGVALPHY